MPYAQTTPTTLNIKISRNENIPLIPYLMTDESTPILVTDSSLQYILNVYSDSSMTDVIHTQESNEYGQFTLTPTILNAWSLQNYYYTITANDGTSSWITIKGVITLGW